VEAVVADVSAAIPDRTSAAEDAAARRRELVAEVQTALVLLRYDPGPIDGAMGPRTRAAIRAFEEDLGWYRTGEIDYDVMRALGISGFTTDTLPRDWFDPLPSDRPAATAAMPGTAPPPEFSEQPADGPPVAPTALGG
jgi:peptidoglycan hydrolase-like protein with peptidoglycan-binding domain